MKCKICKTKFEPKYFLQKTCFNPTCIIEFGKAQKEKIEKKTWKDKKEKHRLESNGVTDLQREINKIVKLIDIKFGFNCIDCGKIFTSTPHAAHYHDIGGHNSLRFHLDNIHLCRSHCNQYDTNHKKGYYLGLASRYGVEYREYLEDLNIKYPIMKFDTHLIAEKLKTTRQIIREFEFMVFGNAIQARKELNERIGIYVKK